jgi:HAD superfamily hydrolase (TIGR01509 family)
VKTVLFDLDGVIIDTERVGHRVAFNKAFIKCGYPDVVWDEDFYHQLLQVGGGKERIKYYFSKYYQGVNPPEDIDEFAKKMHKLKTDIFVEMLPDLPLRSGVHRFMTEWKEAGVKLGICTTSNERVAETVGKKILHDIPFEVIIAGDMVKNKKPAPDIYNMAMEILSVSPEETLVIEDSHIGVTAAKEAGCVVLATYNGYTRGEDLSRADFLVSCLGDHQGEKANVVRGLVSIGEDGVVKASDFMLDHLSDD